MESTFITELNIHHVRHLKNIVIPLSKEHRKNLILTGKNGSGKTSILNALVSHLSYIIGDHISKDECIKQISFYNEKLAADPKTESDHQRKLKYQKQLKFYQDTLMFWTSGATFEYTSLSALKEKYQEGNFILAYFRDNREIEVEDSKNIEKITLKPFYSIKDKPSRDLSKYLVNLKTTQAFAQAKKDSNRVAEIDKWFQKFENILKKIYDDTSLCLDFDIDSFKFSINMNNRDPFDFNTMSTGYAAVFDIIGDLIMRMESKRNYNLEGIVLIDEIETHLHVELQKEILPILSSLFPNLQFICTTHSPFILSSAQNSTLYDLEKHILVENGLTNLPYSGIVESYFSVDTLSRELEEKFDEYKETISKTNLSPKDFAKAAELEIYLDEVPDYLAIDFAEEYARLKLEHRNRGKSCD